MGCPIWYCVTEECQKELKKLLPKNWHAPRVNGKDIEEIDKIMHQKPAKGKDD